MSRNKSDHTVGSSEECGGRQPGRVAHDNDRDEHSGNIYFSLMNRCRQCYNHLYGERFLTALPLS